ncbi:C4-dicarboxylate ABC transporter substrate-binding protein [Ramlibacter albus]|uniref:C4-dicarboxylate ABC transporter substrate-binding protein n=1 Tax=Ramlibacter albus TaxID=2079448 RepID=A0A923S4R4_9BURK|nr:C4-dicarboxylate ABC transporter substrate-binding protein [Ramlibacter albus]MBC5767795.1 C4-dicarboxylate ABC transporter substrate-binding protein [Ramlibacter albus]
MHRLLLHTSAWLVLPLALLLAAQWPLRDVVAAGSRQANDLAQLVFAVYMAVAVSAATRADVHLAARARHAGGGRARAWALFMCVVPWALFVLVASLAPLWSSLQQLERFPETMNPGYFVIKLALALMLLLALADAATAVGRARGHG